MVSLAGTCDGPSVWWCLQTHQLCEGTALQRLNSWLTYIGPEPTPAHLQSQPLNAGYMLQMGQSTGPQPDCL